ncbi:hypothetical protein CK203_057167 [Vitis vinifera]|uniref:PGG domain-containing protein n=1 Tax=Vitis vinifera TaxID=29760 RepID=A0A438GKV0_VITVI|nr:hypothetical protein CK203_057167 [Vitis vinifera]
MTAVAGPEPRDDDWMTSEVQRQEATAAVVMAEALNEKGSHTNEDKTAKKKKKRAEDGSRAEIACMDDTLYKAAAEGHANEDEHLSSLRRAGETHLIVGALIATVTFAADTIAMILSVGAVWFYFLTATAFHLGGKVHGRFFLCGYILTVFGMGAMVVAFMTGLYAVLPPSFGLPILASCCAICCCSYFLAGYVVI